MFFLRELFAKSSLKLLQKTFEAFGKAKNKVRLSRLARTRGARECIGQKFRAPAAANVNRLRKSIEVQQKAYIKLFAEQDFLKRLT